MLWELQGPRAENLVLEVVVLLGGLVLMVVHGFLSCHLLLQLHGFLLTLLRLMIIFPLIWIPILLIHILLIVHFISVFPSPWAVGLEMLTQGAILNYSLAVVADVVHFCPACHVFVLTNATHSHLPIGDELTDQKASSSHPLLIYIFSL